MAKTIFTRNDLIELLHKNGYSLSQMQVSDNYEVYTKKDNLPVRIYKQALAFTKSDLKDLLPVDILPE